MGRQLRLFTKLEQGVPKWPRGPTNTSRTRRKRSAGKTLKQHADTGTARTRNVLICRPKKKGEAEKQEVEGKVQGDSERGQHNEGSHEGAGTLQTSQQQVISHEI